MAEHLTQPDFAEAGYAHTWPDHLPGEQKLLFNVGGKGAAVLNLETRDWHIVQQDSHGAR